MLVAATSCDKYDIYPEEFDGVFAIRDSGTRDLTVYSTDETAEVPFVVVKGGYDPDHVSKATFKVMDSAEFAAYKEASGNVQYAAVGSECYSFSPAAGENVYSIDYEFTSKDDRYRISKLYVRPQEIQTWLSDNAADLAGLTPVIPLTLVSDVDSVSAYNNTSIILLDVQTPALTMDVSGVQARTINTATLTGTDDVYCPEANFSIPCSNPWGFTMNLVADDAAVAAYNTENGTSFTPLPADAYTFVDSYHFAPGITSMPLQLTIDLGKLRVNDTYAVAVKYASTPLVWDNADSNPGSALEVDPSTMVLFTVRVFDAAMLTKINLSSSCVTSNDIEPTEGSIDALFDGVIGGGYFHSGWSVANPRESIYASYLEITLPEPMSRFRFNMANRESPTAAGYVKTVHLFGTNDPANWPTKPFAIITDMNQILNGSAVYGEFGSDEEPFMTDSSVKYLRFCVMESGGGSLGTTTGAVYWCASELELYGN